MPNILGLFLRQGDWDEENVQLFSLVSKETAAHSKYL